MRKPGKKTTSGIILALLSLGIVIGLTRREHKTAFGVDQPTA